MKEIMSTDSLNSGKEKINQNSQDTDNLFSNISVLNIDGFKKGENLLPLNQLTDGISVNATGIEESNATYTSSNFIPIKKGQTYYFGDIQTVAVYTSDKKFTRRIDTIKVGLDVRTFDDNEYFIRANVRLIDKTKAWIGLSKLNQYVPGEMYLDPKLLPLKEMKKVLKSPVEDYFVSSTNLFSDQIIDENIVISSDGVETVNSTYNTTGFIKLEANKTYMGNNAIYISVYDINKKFIKRIQPPNGSPLTELTPFTTPLDTVYGRISYQPQRTDTIQVIEGTQPLPYEKGGIFLKSEYIKLDTEDNHSLENTNKYIPSLNFERYDEVETYENMDNIVRTNTNRLESIYLEYDNLQANNPDYITKTLLGNDSSDTYPIYRYDFKPQKTEGMKEEYPKMIIVSGVHGNETTAIWNLLHTMKNITTNWVLHESLEALRFNIHFIVIPVANPHGVVNFLRRNANDIDIARNFPAKHLAGDQFSDDSPLTQQESILINNVFIENKDAIACIDFHNFFEPKDGYFFLWGANANDLSRQMSNAAILSMHSKWLKEYEFLDSSKMIGYADMNAPGGSLGTQGDSIGIPISLTFESCNKVAANPLNSPNDSHAMKMGTEAFTNFLLKICEQLL